MGASDDIEITRGGEELLPQIRPLWLALRNHHNKIAPDLGPVREDDESWRRRRAQYEAWLQDERSFFLLACRQHRAVGYAFVRVDRQGSPTWEGDGDTADLETLSILPEARGTGLGARLIALVREEVDRQGYAQLSLTAVASNHDALRFYEREGFEPRFVILQDTRRTP